MDKKELIKHLENIRIALNLGESCGEITAQCCSDLITAVDEAIKMAETISVTEHPSVSADKLINKWSNIIRGTAITEESALREFLEEYHRLNSQGNKK